MNNLNRFTQTETPSKLSSNDHMDNNSLNKKSSGSSESSELRESREFKNITEISKESLWSYLSKILLEEGLGQIQHYNVSVIGSSLDDNVGKIMIRISGNNPISGLNIPLIGYINEIGTETFKDHINDMISQNVNYPIKINTNIVVNLFDVIINVNVLFPLISGDDGRGKEIKGKIGEQYEIPVPSFLPPTITP